MTGMFIVGLIRESIEPMAGLQLVARIQPGACLQAITLLNCITGPEWISGCCDNYQIPIVLKDKAASGGGGAGIPLEFPIGGIDCEVSIRLHDRTAGRPFRPGIP